MSTWPNRGASGGPRGGLNEETEQPNSRIQQTESIRLTPTGLHESRGGSCRLRRLLWVC
jgi:hypothetical protein